MGKANKRNSGKSSGDSDKSGGSKGSGTMKREGRGTWTIGRLESSPTPLEEWYQAEKRTWLQKEIQAEKQRWLQEEIEERKFAEIRERGKDRTEGGERSREERQMEKGRREREETPEDNQIEIRALKEKVERLTERVGRLEEARREDNEGSSSGSDGEPVDWELRQGAWWLKVDHRGRINARTRRRIWRATRRKLEQEMGKRESVSRHREATGGAKQ